METRKKRDGTAEEEKQGKGKMRNMIRRDYKQEI
jgi:hypothetical protein